MIVSDALLDARWRGPARGIEAVEIKRTKVNECVHGKAVRTDAKGKRWRKLACGT